MEDRIRKIVQKQLATLGAEAVTFAVEWPADLAHGDYAVNAAMAASKELGRSPCEIAELIVPGLIQELGEEASSVEIAGPGFINITLSEHAVSKQLEKTTEQTWGRNTVNDGQRHMIEYSCPNPIKEMHLGHLMSTVLGESISRLIEYSGAEVIRDTYGGDVGPHVAKALWALEQKGITEPATAKEVGAAYAHGSEAYEASEKAKAEIDSLNVAFYTALAKEPGEETQEERNMLEVWRKAKDASLEEFRRLYTILDTHFDYYFFESEVTPVAMRIMKDALANGVFEESEGAVIYRGEKKGLHTLVFITSRGTPTYEAKDIGLAFYKEERIETDKIIIMTGMEQIGHFQVFLASLEDIAPALAHKTSHVSHGLLRLTTGKMSSREGNVITASEIMQEVLTRTLERNEDPIVAQHVGVGALKYMILRSSPGYDVVFDMEKSLSLEGDSGPYLQYALVRARSILEKSHANTNETNTKQPESPYVLARLIVRFPDIIKKAQALRAPHVVVQYLTQIAGEWNSFYANERIIGEDDEAYKLMVVRAFIRTMENGLWVLGIPAPERM